jgi:hypothetical protein
MSPKLANSSLLLASGAGDPRVGVAMVARAARAAGRRDRGLSGEWCRIREAGWL